LACLLRGEWRESLLYNAMTLPMCALLAVTLSWLGASLLRRQRFCLPVWVLWSWSAVLASAWLLKLSGNPAYW
jgi:hypothetical protein